MPKLTASQAAFILELKSRKLNDPLRQTTRPMVRAEAKATRLLAKAGYYRRSDRFAEYSAYGDNLTSGIKAKLDDLDSKIDPNCIRSAGHLGTVWSGKP